MSEVAVRVAKTPATVNKCPGCGHDMHVFFQLPGVPVNSCLLVDSREEAIKFPRGDISLEFCGGCGFISNRAFREELTTYSGKYEETQGYSGTFNKFHKALAEDLVSRLGLQGKDVVEIGCGKGEFLALLCKLGGNHGKGFDPSYDDSRPILKDLDAHVVKDFFSEKYDTADSDFVACKMTLEHIPETAPFVRAARGVLRPKESSTFFFQIPESMRILKECAFEDIYYEHCSYFTPGSAARLFRSQGFDVRRLDIAYGGQYLTIEGAYGTGTQTPPLPQEETVAEVAALVADFSKRFAEKTAYWRSVVESRTKEGPVVLWGSGSKAVSFLRAVDVPGAINHVVDINPYRHGHFMLGTGQPIVGPKALIDIKPRTIIVMNAIYCEEIAAELKQLGVSAELLAL